MDLNKIFDEDLDNVEKNILGIVNNSVNEAREMQKKKVAENVQIVIDALKKIEQNIKEKYDFVGGQLEKRIVSIKDGRDGINGRDGKDGKDGKQGKDGRPGRDGKDGKNGLDGQNGEDGVSVVNAHIDFDGSLIISLSSGKEINVGEVVAPALAEQIKVITNGGGTSQSVLDTLTSLQSQIDTLSGATIYKGLWNASTNSPALTSSVGTAGNFYIVSVAGSTNLNGITNWGVGDWAIFNGTVWQRVEGGAEGNFTTLTATGGGSLTGTWSSLGTVTTVDINGGTIDGAAIGGATPAAGAFTTLSASGAVTVTTSTAAISIVNNSGVSNAWLSVDNTSIGGKVWRVGDGISTPGKFYIYNQTDNSFPIEISTAGVAVTGTLSATGVIRGTYFDSAVIYGGADNDNFTAVYGTSHPSLANQWEVTLDGANRARITTTGLAVTGSGTSTYSDGATYTLGILSGGASIARIGGTAGTTSLELMVNGSVISTHSLTGLAVTGGISGTTTLQLTGANSLAIGGVSGSYRLQRDSATFQFLNAADNIMLEVSAASISTGSTTALSLATSGGTQVQVANTASANRYITLTGSNGGNPTIGTSAGSLAVSTSLAVTSSGGYLSFTGTSGGKYIGQADAIVTGAASTDLGISAGNNLVIATGGTTERMRIDSSGYVTVNGDPSALGFGAQQFNSVGNSGTSAALFTEASGSNAAVVLMASASTTGYTANMLDIRTAMASGTGFRAIQYASDTNTGRFYVLGNGDVQNTNNSYGAISDVRLKENIVDASPKLSDLMQVRVRNYNIIGDTQKQLGVVAQELESIFPAMIQETVDRDENGDDLGTTTKSVKYSVFVPILVKAIQELKAEFDAYKAAHP